MMLLECPLLVSPILDSLLAVHIRIYTIVGVQATFQFTPLQLAWILTALLLREAVLTYLGRFLQMMHGRVMDVFTRGRFC